MLVLQNGSLLQSRYRIDSLLGKGGMGAVYRATDTRLGVTVAIKQNLLEDAPSSSPDRGAQPPPPSGDPRRDQFEREARLLANLKHTGLPKVTDYFFVPGEGQYLVMDFIEGQDLGQVVRQVGALREEKAVEFILEICGVLEYLHVQEPPVIHRDIKPGNIRITPTGQVMLVDFGVAKVGTSEHTVFGAMAVTPGFSPLEQFGGDRPTDERSDIYSLAATLFALLAGKPPPSATERLMGQRPLFPADSSAVAGPALRPIIEKGMALNPDDRYQTAGGFRGALEGFLQSGAWRETARAASDEMTRPSSPTAPTMPTAAGARGRAGASPGAATPARGTAAAAPPSPEASGARDSKSRPGKGRQVFAWAAAFTVVAGLALAGALYFLPGGPLRPPAPAPSSGAPPALGPAREGSATTPARPSGSLPGPAAGQPAGSPTTTNPGQSPGPPPTSTSPPASSGSRAPGGGAQTPTGPPATTPAAGQPGGTPATDQPALQATGVTSKPPEAIPPATAPGSAVSPLPDTLVVAGFGAAYASPSEALAAFYAARDGRARVILVRPGHYVLARRLWLSRAVTIVGAGPAAGVVLEAGGDQPTIMVEARGVALRNLTIRSTSATALSVSGEATVEGCDITSPGRTAVGLYGRAMLTLRRGRVTGSGNKGILAAEGATCRAEGCEITGNDSGVEVRDQASVVLSDCRVSENRASGVYAHDGGTCEMINCRALNNGSDGVNVKGGTVTLRGCTVSGNRQFGLNCSGVPGNLTVIDSDLSGNSIKAIPAGCAVTRNGTVKE